MAQHLGDEERVSLGLLPHRPGHLLPLVGEAVAGGPLQEGGHGRGIQPRQHDPFHAGAAAQIGQELGEGMGPGQLGVAVRAHHEEPHGLR